MKHKFFITWFFKASGILLLAGLTLSSCKKNAEGTGKVTYKLMATNSGEVKLAVLTGGKTPALSGFTTSGGINTYPSNVTWKEGYFYISEIEFHALKDQTILKYEAKDLVKVDIFGLNSSIFKDVIIPPGEYKEIELEVTIGNTGKSTEPGIHLAGKYGNIPIEFNYNEEGDAFGLEVEGGSYIFDNTKDYSALISLHLNLLLKGVSNADLDAAAKTNGVIIIDKGSNTAIYQQAKENLQQLSDVDFHN